MAGGEKKKIALVIVLFLVAGGIFYYFTLSKAPLSDKLPFVDVTSGRLYHLDRRDVPSILPATNPDTGVKTLVPAEQRDGKLFVKNRYKGLLPELGKDNRYVDEKTLEVRPPR